MKSITKIKVVGIGGSGSNAVSRMKKCKIRGVELIAINTDAQDLQKTKAHLKLRIGRKSTQGLGTGMNPEVGKLAAEEQKEEIKEILKGSDMIFIAGGEGGGTCTGAAPVVAQIARDLGILTIAIVTKPFSFEGAFRQRVAENGFKKLREKVDAIISISNDKLLYQLPPDISLFNAFWICDDILREAVQGITDLIFLPGIINIDFADVKAIMKDSGTAIFGVGKAKGEKRAEVAALSALHSPLLDTSPKGAKGVLFNVSGGKDIAIAEINEIGEIITREINPKAPKEGLKAESSSQARVIFGAVQSETLKEGEIKVTVIATGF